jgi:hypothetical protein
MVHRSGEWYSPVDDGDSGTERIIVMFHELDTVALTRDLSEYGLKAGAEGVVLLTHDWAVPQGLTLEFFTGDHPWTLESGQDYPAVTISLSADQVRLVRHYETQGDGQMHASEAHRPRAGHMPPPVPRHPE